MASVVVAVAVAVQARRRWCTIQGQGALVDKMRLHFVQVVIVVAAMNRHEADDDDGGGRCVDDDDDLGA